MTILRGPMDFGGCQGAATRTMGDALAPARPSPVAQNSLRSGPMALLARTIEGEIIPRLMLAHRAQPYEAPSTRGPVTPDEVADFAGLLLSRDSVTALASIDAMRADGVALEHVFLDLIAPAARHLGELWKADLCDFTDVTIGLSRLHQVVRTLSSAFVCEADVAEHGRRALIAPLPGEQHAFGAVIVDEFLRRAGWDVTHLPETRRDELLDLVATEWFEFVGLSLSCGGLLDGLPSLIRSIREASLNPELWVMVGGAPFVADPDLVWRVGADATAADGRQAVRQAQHLLKARSAHA